MANCVMSCYVIHANPNPFPDHSPIPNFNLKSIPNLTLTLTLILLPNTTSRVHG